MTEEEIRNYCLNCPKKPCSVNGCPLNNDIPAFIHEKNLEEAYEILCDTTVLPAVCGRICPHERQCQGSCIRGIRGESVSIGQMEAFIGDASIRENYKIPKLYNKYSETIKPNSDKNKSIKPDNYNNYSNKKVAVVGGGPAGLTCAAFLARHGVKVTIYEKHSKLGGLLSYGIPNFRLPTEVVDKTIEKILDLGIETKLNTKFGKDIQLEELTNNYDAVFIGIGANIPAKMKIEGEELQGVYGGNELLGYSTHPQYEGKDVAVIGGGNVAIDVARTIKRRNAKNVYIIYRRAKEQMPADKKEVEAAEKEGINFLFQTNIVRVLDDVNESLIDRSTKNGATNNRFSSQNSSKNELLTEPKQVKAIECVKTKLIEQDGKSRPIPVNIDGSNYVLKIDFVVMATGSKPEKDIISKFEKNKSGYILVNENMQTSMPKVYAGGDIVGEKATVAWAAKSGRNAAEKILENL